MTNIDSAIVQQTGNTAAGRGKAGQRKIGRSNNQSGLHPNHAEGAAPARLITPTVAGILALWGVAIVWLGQAGAFAVDVGGVPIGITLAVSLPVILFLLAYRQSVAVRAWVGAQDIALLTAVQGWRVLGASFVFLWLFGYLPAMFAVPAGFGDVAVGLAAPFAAITVARRVAGWTRAAWAVIAAGLFDFAVAFVTGIGSISGNFLQLPGTVGSDVVNQLPLLMIPGYFVPIFAIGHVMAIIQLRAAR